jgi:hypothetical protein
MKDISLYSIAVPIQKCGGKSEKTARVNDKMSFTPVNT